MSPEVKGGAEAGGDRTLARSARLVSGLILCSRVLGLVREQVFAALLGAGLYADAFQAAFKIPNLLRDLFAEGALSAAFIPTYAQVLSNQGREEAHRLSSRLLSLLWVLLGGLVALGMLFAGGIVGLIAPGFEHVPGKTEATVLLTRVMLPFLPLISTAAVAMGMLNAEERYGPPALAPAMFNAVMILWAALLWAMGFSVGQVAIGWAIGTLLGGLAQFATQLPALRRQGWRYQAEWAPGDPGIRQIGRLMAPATVGLAAVQVNIFVSVIFASREPGAVSWLTYAFRILYLPIGVFGVAIGTIAGAGLARRAAVADMDGVRETLRQSLRMLAFLTVPATVGLVMLRIPIVRLLFERGKFTAADTSGTAAALLFYTLGLVAYSGVKVLAPAFYALGTPRPAVAGSALAVATNLVVIVTLYGRMGYTVMALGTSAGAMLNVLLLAVVFERRLGGLRRQGLGRAFASMGAAAALMVPVVWLTWHDLEARLGTHGLPAQLATGLAPVATGALAYVGAALVLRIPEAGALLGFLHHRRAA